LDLRSVLEEPVMPEDLGEIAAIVFNLPRNYFDWAAD